MESRSPAALSVAGRMALIALVIGTSVTASATERVTASLVLVGAVGWSFVPLIQLFTGLLLVRGISKNRLRLLDRYFSTHWPWSLWILGAHLALLASPALRRYSWWVTVTAFLPMLATVWLLLRFCRQDLGIGRNASWGRVVTHQSATYGIALAYVFVAVALWPRILGLFT